MRRGLSSIGLLGAIIVGLAVMGVSIALLFQGINPDTVASLQSCNEGVIATVTGPLRGESNELKCFSSRFEPKFPKEEGKDCPEDQGFVEEGEYCVGDGSENWQYLLKMGCPEEKPYCWSQGKALSANQLINAEQKIEEQNQPEQEVNKEVCIGSGDPSNRLTQRCVGEEPEHTFTFSEREYKCVKTQDTDQISNGKRSVYCSSERLS